MTLMPVLIKLLNNQRYEIDTGGPQTSNVSQNERAKHSLLAIQK